jgi:hypothetical protein
LEHQISREHFRRRHPKAFKHIQRLRALITTDGYSLVAPERLKCIFVHVPKTAGISIAQCLFGNSGPGHIPLSTYRLIYSPHDYDSYFKFAFVRNPWDRLVSAFHYLKAGGMNSADQAFANRHLIRFESFESFVVNWVNPHNIQLYCHFQPQLHFISLDGRLPQLDFIGYFETLAVDFDFVRKTLGVAEELPSLNKSDGQKRDYRSQYTERSRRIVAQVYADDIATLGYAFDNSNLQAHNTSRRLIESGSCSIAATSKNAT